MANIDFRDLKIWVAGLVILAFAVIPLFAFALNDAFYLAMYSRIMIYALAAVGLNLILGFGGMTSLGHALYIGIGAYGVGMLDFHGISNGWLQLSVALAVGAVFALFIGAVVVRLTGMTFIMITLAFAQMGYFLTITLRAYGGEDGRAVTAHSDLYFLDLSNPYVLYYVIFVCLVAALWCFNKTIKSRFGMVIRGSKSNERRMQALGFPTFRYKLTAYVISALLCVLAGFLLANLTLYASPSYMQWTMSAELIIMVILGGMFTVFGPVVGALVFLLLEEQLSNFHSSLFPSLGELINEHWLAVLGVFVIIVVLTARNGIFGYVGYWSRK
ncbi:branched-chain amino acid ABC transporter permease [Pusillimonas sp. T2]|uniref:branched-chain amino acid ABC transporter permease n=1 Tax=Pusillimonas sp. T2 TaxID=1548123 RepID=UPI000B8B6ACD|nr:branched-chain amino acid ABC transporter permease [Pusillimonas sp. T2]OXR48068.1 branched-chain amino acid ABC transporter permease [Pusillimonas sp. T2]